MTCPTARLTIVIWMCLLAAGCVSYSYMARELRPLDQPLAAEQISDLKSRNDLVFLVFGDSGTGDRHQSDVAEGMMAACKTQPNGCDFALVLGDNVYNRGVKGVDDPAFDKKFASKYDAFDRLDFWVVPGNHDWLSQGSVQAEIDYTRQSKQWRMPSSHFAVPALPQWLHLYGLDTTVMYDLTQTSDAAKKAALADNQQKQLAAAKQSLCDQPGWRLLFAHHPVYSDGEHGYEDGRGVLPSIQNSVEREVILPCKAAVYFSGHDHDQELLFAEKAGYYQVIQGASATLRPVRRRQEDGVKQVFACGEYGFLLARATAQSMEMSYYGCGPDGRSGACREIQRARLTLSADGGLHLEQIAVAGSCAAPPKG